MMKRSMIAALATGLTLMIAGTLANAACSPNPCYRQFLQCRASGISYYECYGHYEDCLARYGCPIP
jgi:hypothetical protein